MAKTVSRSADAAPSEEDFHLWVQRRADLLRRGRFRDLDVAHLIEEIEDLGANLRSAVTSRTREMVLHLLKLEYVHGIKDPGS